MINEAKFELLKQIDFWIQDLQKYEKQHKRELDLFCLERIAITNMNNKTMEPIIRKYEQLKMLYLEITHNHSQKYLDDTFSTLYNKYCNEKKIKQSSQSQKKSQNNNSMKTNKNCNLNQSTKGKQSVQQILIQPIQPNLIIDEYIDEIDYYSDKIINLQHKIEQHSHENLQKQLYQLQLEQEGLISDYRSIIEENEKLKEEIQNNAQRVNELRELQLQLIDEFKQFN